MANQTLTLQRRIPASADAVWSVITDLEGAERVLPGVTKIEILEGPEYRVGTTWRETRKVGGMKATETMTVTAVDPVRSTTVAAKNGDTLYTTRFDLQDTGVDSVLTMEFGADSEASSRAMRLLGAITAPLGVWMTRGMMTSDLNAIARAAMEIERGDTQ